MRRFAWLAVVALAACGGAETPADTTAAAPAPAPPANLTAADVSGTWIIKGMSEAGDSLITYDLVATGDTTGWAVVFPGGQRVPMTSVTFSGDSVVSMAGPFNSELRRGVRVRNVTSTARMQDGRMMGTTVVRYDTKAADSVLIMRTEGTRKP